MARQLRHVESEFVARTPTGSRVRWTFAADSPEPLRIVLRLGRPGLGRAFKDAMRNLDRRLNRSSG